MFKTQVWNNGTRSIILPTGYSTRVMAERAAKDYIKYNFPNGEGSFAVYVSDKDTGESVEIARYNRSIMTKFKWKQEHS